MELKKYLQIAGKNLTFVLVVAFIGALSAYLSAPHIQSGFQVQNSFFLSSEQMQTNSPQNYNFGGYFSQSAAINATDTAVAILQSTDFQSQLPFTDAILSIRKIAPQVIQITAASKDKQAAKTQMENIPKFFNQKLEQLNPEGPTLKLSQISNQITPSYHSMNSKLIAVAGFIFGIIFAFLVLGLKTYIET